MDYVIKLTITTNIEETKSQERNILDMLPINTQQEQIYDFNVFRFYGFKCCKQIFNSSFQYKPECFYLRFLLLDFKVCEYSVQLDDGRGL